MEPTSIVITGHVDHGKSTFIGRLLHDTGNLSADRLADIKKASEESGRRMEFAFVTDQFQEERDANVTIDTSQTFLNLEGRPYIIVDAPGHKQYLKNMITGATQAKHGIIMLDVSEGIREQTEKHARILKLCSIKHVAVFVNKLDTVDFSESVFRKQEAEVLKLMSEIGIPAPTVIPLSAYNGDNVATRSPKMSWYKGPTALDFILGCAAMSAEAAKAAPLRFPVQVVYNLNGRTLLLGRVEQGKITKGQTVSVFPGKAEAEVRDVLKFNEKISSAGDGECIAVELSSKDAPQRGNVLTNRPAQKPADTVSVHAFWASNEPLRPGDEILVECRTQNALFQVVSVADEVDRAGAPLKELAGGDVGQVVLKSRAPVLIDAEPEGSPMSRLVFHKNGQVAGCGVVAHVA
jgi:bifunctional enzyme CysN/CysC